MKDKRQKLMKIFWGERELTNILNKKILKYHFLSCICIYIKFQKMFHSSDHEKRERERETERERERCGTSRCTERSEVKDKRQKLMKISWERERANEYIE